MRFNRSNKGKKAISEINIVPYVDVMLVLLVIFMVTVPLLHQSVKVELPNAEGKLAENIDVLPLILTVDAKKRLYLNLSSTPDKPIYPDDVVYNVAAHLKLAKEKNKNLPIMVRGDKNIDYQTMVNAILLLKRAGATNIGLVTTPEY